MNRVVIILQKDQNLAAHILAILKAAHGERFYIPEQFHTVRFGDAAIKIAENLPAGTHLLLVTGYAIEGLGFDKQGQLARSCKQIHSRTEVQLFTSTSYLAKDREGVDGEIGANGSDNNERALEAALYIYRWVHKR